MSKINEVIFKGSFVTKDSEAFIEKLNNFINEQDVEFEGKVLVFPIDDYTEYEEVTDDCETKTDETEVD